MTLLEQFYVPQSTECCTAKERDKIFWHGDGNAVRNAGGLFKMWLLIVQEDTLFAKKEYYQPIPFRFGYDTL